jgi:hypothetical protein
MCCIYLDDVEDDFAPLTATITNKRSRETFGGDDFSRAAGELEGGAPKRRATKFESRPMKKKFGKNGFKK